MAFSFLLFLYLSMRTAFCLRTSIFFTTVSKFSSLTVVFNSLLVSSMGTSRGGYIPISRKIDHICVLLDLARTICPDITLSFHIFPVYRVEK